MTPSNLSMFPATCTCRIFFSASKPRYGPPTTPSRFAGPWVTSLRGATVYKLEIAASLSGGGFSNYFQRPSYQQQATPTFLRNLSSRYQSLYQCVRLRDVI